MESADDQKGEVQRIWELENGEVSLYIDIAQFAQTVLVQIEQSLSIAS